MSLVAKLRGVGPSGFGGNTTAEEVTQGLDLHGKTYLITGCGSGLGKETLRVLAMRGAKVLGTARSIERARSAMIEVGAVDAVPLVCELSDPASVRACIAEVERLGVTLDAIICNAGVMAMPKRQTAHGYELQFFTNHVGHFILVNGLLDRLSPTGRVVMLSSAAHRGAPSVGIRLDDLGAERSYGAWDSYGQSKLANILFANELARRFDGTGRTANAVHPGVIVTELWRHMPKFAGAAIKTVTPLFLKTPEQGAATTCYVATHPSLEKVSGRYFADCNVSETSAHGRNAELARKLWERTEQIVAGLP